MRRTIQLALLTSVLVGLAATAVRVEAAEPELDGLYLAQGVSPDGSPYHGLVGIARSDNIFFVTWFVVDDSSETIEPALESVGLALRNNGMLAVSYYSPDTASLALLPGVSEPAIGLPETSPPPVERTRPRLNSLSW